MYITVMSSITFSKEIDWILSKILEISEEVVEEVLHVIATCYSIIN